jgi:hypothetical protein
VPKQAQGASRPCCCSPPMPRSGPDRRWSRRPTGSTTSTTAGRARCGGTVAGAVRPLPAGSATTNGVADVTAGGRQRSGALNVLGRKVRVNVVSARRQLLGRGPRLSRLGHLLLCCELFLLRSGRELRGLGLLAFCFEVPGSSLLAVLLCLTASGIGPNGCSTSPRRQRRAPQLRRPQR